MKYEIITYSRSTGDITHSKRLYSTRWNVEAALRTAGSPKIPACRTSGTARSITAK
nr:MAG TPA: hypothetical protein [Caudoviricetes sp.]